MASEAIKMLIQGTHLGPFAGIPPTGNHVQWEAMRIWRLADNRIVETWAVRDRLDVRQQLGAAPRPAQGLLPE